MNFFEFLRKALSEDNNKPSSMRVLNLWTMFWFVLVVSFGFVYVVLFYSSLVIAYLSIISSVILGVLGLKKWQKANEKSK